MSKRVEELRELNNELQKLLNRKQYLDGWARQRDVESDQREYGNILLRISDIEWRLKQLSRRHSND